MPFSLQNFRNQALAQGGYRPSLFEVQVDTLGEEFNLLCMSSQVPTFTTGIIEVPYFGRKIKVAGDRTFQEWTTTVMLEEDFSQRQILEDWAQQINAHDTGQRDGGFFAEAYKKAATIKMYGKTGDKIREYELEGCWPTDVGTIELDWNTNDTIGTYTVTWAFDYMRPGFA
jgi:hypothetical protein